MKIVRHINLNEKHINNFQNNNNNILINKKID